MQYREQEVTQFCVICREPASTQCTRCDEPFCKNHAQSEEERCQACENLWIEKSSGRSLGRWGRGSGVAVRTAKWSAIVGGTGIALVVGAVVVPALAFLGGPLLLGFPISIAALLALPFLRAGERTVDRLESHHRRKFLAERSGRLPSPTEPKQLAE